MSDDESQQCWSGLLPLFLFDKSLYTLALALYTLARTPEYFLTNAHRQTPPASMSVLQTPDSVMPTPDIPRYLHFSPLYKTHTL